MTDSASSNPRFDAVICYKISDLIFATRIEEICLAKKKEFARAGSFETLEDKLRENNLVVCDLVSVSKELGILKNVSKEKGSQIFGYYPHVDKETETLARTIGIDFVVPRSALQAKLRSILS